MESGAQARRFRVTIRGQLSERLGSAFPGLKLERRPGLTVISGLADQTRLQAVLDRLRDFGIEPVSTDVDG